VSYRTPIADLIAYGEEVQRRYVSGVKDVEVSKLYPSGQGFRLELADGTVEQAARVVVATGLTGLQRMPVIAGMPESHISHASAHADLARFANQRVLVIGAGQSAFETAALLHENGAKVQVITRRKPFWFAPEGEADPTLWTRIRHPNFGLGPGWRAWLWSEQPILFSHLPAHIRLANAYSTFGPAGSGWLYHRVVGKIEITTGQIQTAEAIDNSVLVRTVAATGEAKNFLVDHVIAATGYHADIRRIGFLAPVLPQIATLADGIPALDRGFQTSLPGLHMIGYLSAPSLGPSMRFIYGTNFAAPQLARVLKRNLKTTTVGYSGNLSAATRTT